MDYNLCFSLSYLLHKLSGYMISLYFIHHLKYCSYSTTKINTHTQDCFLYQIKISIKKTFVPFKLSVSTNFVYFTFVVFPLSMVSDLFNTIASLFLIECFSHICYILFSMFFFCNMLNKTSNSSTTLVLTNQSYVYYMKLANKSIRLLIFLTNRNQHKAILIP